MCELLPCIIWIYLSNNLVSIVLQQYKINDNINMYKISPCKLPNITTRYQSHSTKFTHFIGDEAISLVLELQPVSAKSKHKGRIKSQRYCTTWEKRQFPIACWSKERWQGLGIILPVSSKFGLTVYISFSLLAWTRHASSTLQRQGLYLNSIKPQ